MSLSSGTRLGPVRRLVPLIGEGGMGEVYRARDTRLGRTVAIKVLPAGAAADPERRRRFEQEARAASALNHPHICVLHDIGSDGGTDFLVMEHLDGQSLAERLGKGPLPLEQALDVGIEIADALAVAHKQGIIHRDLKPANVMLTKAGAKLLDFGLAKLRVPGAHLGADFSSLPTQASPETQKGTILGTLAYMAPEQLEGKEADARGDLFSFGAMLYEMLTGRRAFEGTSPASVISAVMSSHPQPVSRLQPTSPPALDRVLTRCLAKDPDERWESARDMAAELRWMREANLNADVAPSSARRTRQWPGVAIAFAAGAILLGAIASLWPRPPGPPAPVVRFAVELPVPRELESLSLSPDGTKLAYTGSETGQSRIYVRSFDTGFDVPLAGTEGARVPFFSPDSTQVGYFVGDKVMRVPLAGGEPTSVWRLPAVRLADRNNAATWMDDGGILCAAGAAGLWRVPLSGAEARRVATLDAARGEVSFGRVTSLGSGLDVLLHVRGGGTIDPTPVILMSPDTGVRRTLIPEGRAPHFLETGHVLYWVRGGRLVAQALDSKSSGDSRITNPGRRWRGRLHPVLGVCQRRPCLCLGAGGSAGHARPSGSTGHGRERRGAAAGRLGKHESVPGRPADRSAPPDRTGRAGSLDH